MTAPPPRIEVVRSDGRKPWHGRIFNNGRLVWSTPQHTRMIGVERSILSAARVWGWGPLSLRWNIEGVEKAFVDEFLEPAPGLPVVTYIDDRLHPVKRPELKLAGA
jgi:hypothetical protein